MESAGLLQTPQRWNAASRRGTPRRRLSPGSTLLTLLLCATLLGAGCHHMIKHTDREVEALIEARQQTALGCTAAVDIDAPRKLPLPDRTAYAYDPSPTTAAVPPQFEAPTSQPASAPASAASMPTTAMATQPAADLTTQPTSRRAKVFTLTDALAYAQRHRREYQSAKEQLYLAALNLTLERHLWTPTFASQLKTVYGNYGEAQDFDQAMRFVADLSVSQRLPYGGEFTAGMISTLIRDVKKSITASEDSSISLGLNIPLLRGAGHVARETLIQLERELTYAVRVFERFHSEQVVAVARAYFNLLRAKQSVLDSLESLKRSKRDFERASALERAGTGTLLDTQRAQQDKLGAESRLVDDREAFRSQADQFKLIVGMPVDEPLGLDDLEDIETIERQIEAGVYPLLRRVSAVDDERLALKVALERRFDMLTSRDRVEDARRGVAISRNALLPDLDWTGSLTFDTDPDQYNLGAFHFDRANWRTELVLDLPLERTAERNDLRRSLISVRQAQRSQHDLAERIRVDVRRAINQIYQQERSLEIQRQAVFVAERRREYALYRYEEVGDISNRDRVEAEDAWRTTRNRLNLAKTSGWSAVLEFRLATETLHIDEDGTQNAGSEFPAGVPATTAP